MEIFDIGNAFMGWLGETIDQVHQHREECDKILNPSTDQTANKKNGGGLSPPSPRFNFIKWNTLFERLVCGHTGRIFIPPGLSGFI